MNIIWVLILSISVVFAVITGNLDNLKPVENKQNYSFVKGDICSKEDVEKVVPGCDVIVNFAAESHVDRSIEDSGLFLGADISGVHRLLETVRKFKIKKLIHIYSKEV